MTGEAASAASAGGRGPKPGEAASAASAGGRGPKPSEAASAASAGGRGPETPGLLPPALLARLGRLRLVARRRVDGRFAGAHTSRRYGSSQDFADYREYVPGDDPRWVDPHAHARLGRLLVRLFEAEDEAALRLVLDCSASMGFGDKLRCAAQTAAGLAAVATAGGDRIRLLLASGAPPGDGVQAGPWLRGPEALPRIQSRLLGVEAGGVADLRTALEHAHSQGPRGPVVVLSDLLTDEWPALLRELAAGPGDRVLVHVLGRADISPGLDGDVRLADSETGAEIEVGVATDVLDGYRAAADRWLDEVARECGRRGIAYARLMDDESVDALLAVTLTGLGVLA